MKVLALNFTSSEIYGVILEGTKANPQFNSKVKINLPSNYDTARRVEWFETEINSLLNEIHPDAVHYRLTINRVTNQYVFCVYYGQAILNLLCKKKGIIISSSAPASITPSKFNQPKGTDLNIYIDTMLGTHPPHWNDKMRDAALIALNNLQ